MINIYTKFALKFALVYHVIFRHVPLVVSTGMSDWKQVENIYEILKGREGGFALLQCTSCYPTPPESINLNVIDKYREAFPEVVIGYSGNVHGSTLAHSFVNLIL